MNKEANLINYEIVQLFFPSFLSFYLLVVLEFELKPC
jgi:hypothetical protein